MTALQYKAKSGKKIINDAVSFLTKCKEVYEHTDDYPLLLRAINKQIKIIFLTIGLLGRKPKEILVKFKLDKTGFAIRGCPARNSPKSGSYIKQTDSIRVSFHWNQCEGCPYREKGSLKLKKWTVCMLISLKSRRHVLQSTDMSDEDKRKFITRIRNGIETVQSVIRNKYLVDKMPVRVKLKLSCSLVFKLLP